MLFLVFRLEARQAYLIIITTCHVYPETATAHCGIYVYWVVYICIHTHIYGIYISTKKGASGSLYQQLSVLKKLH